jgi:hypothetical protein
LNALRQLPPFAKNGFQGIGILLLLVVAVVVVVVVSIVVVATSAKGRCPVPGVQVCPAVVSVVVVPGIVVVVPGIVVVVPGIVVVVVVPGT